MTISTPARSKVVLQQSPTEPVIGVAQQLLGGLGHVVELADSPEAAVLAAGRSRADLLVLSVTDPDEQVRHLERLALLPAAVRPKQVAILSDGTESDPLLARALPGVKVQIFSKAVHALGLLNVVKRLVATSN